MFAVVAGTTLGAICFLILRRRKQVSRAWIPVFAIAPFLGGLYCFAAFILYGIWCETIRGVDFGTGDGFRVQLGNHYEFQAIDTPANAFLVDPDDAQLHAGLEQIGRSGNFIYGEDSTGFFLIDAPKHSEIAPKTANDLFTALRDRGVPNPELDSPAQFYGRHRFGMPDLAAGLLILTPPVIGFSFLIWSFYRALQRRPCDPVPA